MTNYEFFTSLLSTIPEDSRNITLYGYLILILISLIGSLLISHLYLKYFDKNSTGSKIHRSFPLMGPAITTIFLTIQFSLPLSLGLLGALSIVRFRTPIKEPEEIGFIMLLIATSIAIATFNVAFCVLLYLLMFIALPLLKYIPGFNDSNSTARVLNVTIQNLNNTSMTIANDISAKLKENGIPNEIKSVHSSDNQAHLTIFLNKSSKQNVSQIDQLVKDFPGIAIDYYQA